MDAKEFLKSEELEIDEGCFTCGEESDYIEDRHVEQWLNKFREIELKNFARKFNIDKEDVLDYIEENQ